MLIVCLVSVQLKAYRPQKLAKLSRRQKSISRIYGGHLDHKVVRERYPPPLLPPEGPV